MLTPTVSEYSAALGDGDDDRLELGLTDELGDCELDGLVDELGEVDADRLTDALGEGEGLSLGLPPDGDGLTELDGLTDELGLTEALGETDGEVELLGETEAEGL